MDGISTLLIAGALLIVGLAYLIGHRIGYQAGQGNAYRARHALEDYCAAQADEIAEMRYKAKQEAISREARRLAQ